MADYNSTHKGLEIDENVAGASIPVDDIVALNAIDITGGKVSVGKIVEVQDIGDGTKADYVWNGISWQLDAKDVVRIKDGGSISTENDILELKAVETSDDKGFRVLGGQLSVEEGEFIVGRDSFPVNMAYQYSTATETGLTITGATDITSVLRSDTGSSVDMFQSNTSGEIILVGADEPFFGVKVKYDTNGTVEPENIVGEYLNNVGVWDEDTFMTTNSSPPYQQVGWNVSLFPNEQIRFGRSLLSESTWALQTLNINGSNVTKYWARIRLVTPITSIPILQQVKQHPSRIEMESEIIEFYGLARPEFTLLSGIRTAVPNAASDPANRNVGYFSDGLSGATAKYVDNRFANNTIDSTMLIIPFVSGLDTSTPLAVYISFYVQGTETGDIEITGEYLQVFDEFEYNTETDPEGTVKVQKAVTVPSNNKRQTIRFEVPVNRVGSLAGGGVVITVSRDATSDNSANDNVGASIVLTNAEVRGRRWRL